MISFYILLLGFSTLSQAGTVTYAIPISAPTNAAALEPAPIGVSIEFFTFPAYINDVTSTNQCLQNLEALTGTWPPLRIGGTTQDRATYDPSLSQYVNYTVPSPKDAPTSLTFGPSFMELAGTYRGSVVLGLNRGQNDIGNTIAAAKVATQKIPRLLAIELGNEPEYWAGAQQPIAVQAGAWTPATDAQSQDNWGILVGQAVNMQNIIQAGNSLSAPPIWGAAELIATENDTVKSYVRDYAHHNYPGGSVDSLMSHAHVSSNMGVYKDDIAAANGVGKDYVFGETNSVAGGGGATVCPTFGAALWTLDSSLRAASSNIKRMYFHHGTIGYCYYCWWGRYSMGNPYYGAYMAAAAMANGANLVALDDGQSNYAAYVIYDNSSNPLRAVLYNSDYYDGSSTRGSQTFVLTGFTKSSVQAKRLTATSALSRADQGQPATFGGQTFQDGTCQILNSEVYENVTVEGGSATFTLQSSEALLVYC